MDLLHVRTDFGPGLTAKALWWTASIGAFSVFMTVHKDWDAGHISTMAYLGIEALVGVLFAGFAAAGQAISKRHQPREQAKRDARARQILEAVRTHKEPDFSLFLRAFETTGKMPGVTAPNYAVGFDPRGEEDKVEDFERLLAESVEAHIPLIAVGRPGEQIGAGRIETTDERWKEQVELLANAAVVIFLFPSARPGTLWETDWLVQHGLHKKTIFVMPPKPNRGGYDWAAIWPQLVVVMRDRGIEFPSYDPKGRLFALGNDLRVSTNTRLHAGSITRIMMKDVLKQLKGMASQPKTKQV